MEAIVEENVAPDDLAKHRKQYEKEKMAGVVSSDSQFAYAWCLVRSQSKADMTEGLKLLEDLFHKTKDEQAKRDYLYYLAIGNTRLKNYDVALKFINGILTVEETNHQAAELKKYVEKKMKKDGLLGMAIVGGGALVGGAAVLVLGGLIGLGMALKKK